MGGLEVERFFDLCRRSDEEMKKWNEEQETVQGEICGKVSISSV